MALNKALLADLPPAQPTNPALRPPPLRGMGLSFVSQADDKDWDRPRRKRAMPYVQRKLNYDNAKRRWKKGGLFGWGRGPKPPAPPAPPPEFAPYVKGVLSWGLAKFFDESKVKRDEDGKFAPKGEGERRSRLTGLAPRERSVASIYSRGPQYEEKDRPEYDWSRSVRPTKDMPFKVRQAYEQYRGELNRNPPAAPERGAKVELPADLAPQLPTAGGGRFKMVDMRPQVPSTMTKDEYTELGAWAGQRTREVRDEHIKRSIGRKDPGGHRGGMLLPAGTDPKDRDVKLAYNMARNLAMHDVGLISYDYRMTPETIQALQPHRTFIKHTRRYLGNILRSERPGVWAQFRREFGKEFADGRTHKFDTAGQKAGEKKKYFERHLNFLKSWNAGALSKAFGKPGLSEAEIEQRRNAAKARWARWARRADERDEANLKRQTKISRTEYFYRGFEPPEPTGWRLAEKPVTFDPKELDAAQKETGALVRQWRDAERKRDASVRQPSAKEVAKYKVAMKEYEVTHAKWSAEKNAMLAAKADEFDAANNPKWKLSGRVRDGRIRGTSGLSAEAGRITKETNKAMAGSEPVPPKSPYQPYAETPEMRDLSAKIKLARQKEDFLRSQRASFELERGRGFRWTPKDEIANSLGIDYPAKYKRNARRDSYEMRIYDKEPFYREAERAHVARVKAVREGRRAARIRQLFATEEMAPSAVPTTPTAPRAVTPKSPRLSFGGKAALAGATVLGAGALGYGIARWRQGSSLGKAVVPGLARRFGGKLVSGAKAVGGKAMRRVFPGLRQHWKANARQGALSAGLLGGSGAALYATRERKPQREAI